MEGECRPLGRIVIFERREQGSGVLTAHGKLGEEGGGAEVQEGRLLLLIRRVTSAHHVRAIRGKIFEKDISRDDSESAAE